MSLRETFELHVAVECGSHGKQTALEYVYAVAARRTHTHGHT